MCEKEHFLEFEYINNDDGLLRIRGSNGLFSGFVEHYVGEASLRELVENLLGFPRTIESEVSFNIENSLELKFICEDNLGHCSVWVSMKNNFYKPDKAEEATFKIKFEPGSLDQFSNSLSNCLGISHGFARLLGVERHY